MILFSLYAFISLKIDQSLDIMMNMGYENATEKHLYIYNIKLITMDWSLANINPITL